MRRSYTLKFKRQVIDDQVRNYLSNNEVCRLHGIQLQNLKRWKEGLNAARFQSKSKRSLCAGRKSVYFEHEESIKQHILSMREQKFVVNVRSIIHKLHELCPTSLEKTFRSKSMWVHRFLARHGFTQRRITRTVSISDDVLSERKVNFYQQVESRLARYPATIFVNVDQTAVLHGSVGSRTIECIGARSVTIQDQGKQTDRVTINLAVASNGEKLLPFMIVKGTSYGRVSREMTSERGGYPRDIVYAANNNAWMTESLMLEWIDNVFVAFLGTHNSQHICLVMDSFQVHLKPSVSQKLTDLGIEIIFIPGGLTPDLQPLDIGVNGPFKHWLQEHSIFRQGFERFNAGQKRLEIARAVSHAWETITSETIVNSFGRMLATTFENIEEADEVE